MTGVNGRKPELTSFRDAVLADTARRAGVKVKDAKKLRAAAERATPTMPEDSGIKLVQASAITPRKASWLWNPYLPLGALSLIAGAPGLGKTQLQVHLAAEVTRGRLDGDLHGEPRDVVMATAEDALAETMVPRLMAAGADLDRIHFIQVAADELGFFDIGEDLDALEAVAKAIEPALITLDPLVSFIDGVDSHKDQSVRRVLGPLSDLAVEHQVAINGLIHLNKRDGHDALTRISGSIAFTAASRSVLMLGADRQADGGLHLVHVKSNLGPSGASLGCHIEPATVETADGDSHTSRIVITGESTVRAEDLLSGPMSAADRSARDEAADFLRGELADGPRPAKELERQWKDLGGSATTLRRAREDVLGIKPKQVRDGDRRYWAWALPGSDDARKAPKKRKKAKKKARREAER